MAGRSMSLDVLVRLRDQLTGPLRRLRDQLKSLSDFARKIGMLGAAIAAISFMGPIKEAAAFQQKLLDIAVTSGLSGKKAFAYTEELRKRFYELGIATGQATDDIASGYGQMIAAGLDPKLIDASIGTISKAATAANAEFADMSQVSIALLQTLKVPADQLEDSLGALVTAGKLGSFELKDMAKYFPSLTSQMAKFGVTGREAVDYLGAALQVARKGTSEPAEAANNLKNFLSKILAPATIKNFKEAGVDIEAVMKDAATKGINPIEAVMQKIVKLTGVSGTDIAAMMKKAQDQGLSGADALAQVREQLEKIHGAGKLGEIFADQQVMDFLIPFLSNVDEYKRIKEEVAKATGAAIDKDFETQIKALNQQLQIFDNIRQHASDEVGLAFGEWLPWLNTNLAAAIKWYREFNEANDDLGRRLLTIAGGGVIAAVALGALGIALPIIGAGFGALLALLSPVGLAIAAVAGGAVWLWKNWDTYGERVIGYWKSAKRMFWDFADGVRFGAGRLWKSGRDMWDAFSPRIFAGLERAWTGAKDGFSSFIDSVGSYAKRLRQVAADLATIFGPRIFAGLESAWNDVKDGWENLKGFVDTIREAADLDFEWPDFTIDDAELALIKGLEAAMTGLSTAWESLKGFGSGFALKLPDMGEDIGKTIKSFGEIADSLGRLAAAIGKLIGFDMSKMSEVSTWLGEAMGAMVAGKVELFSTLAEGLSAMVKSMADIAEKVAAGTFEWSDIFPQTAIDGVKAMSKAVGEIIAFFGRLVELVKSPIDWSALLPDAVVQTWERFASAIAAVKAALDAWNAPQKEVKAKVDNVVQLDQARMARNIGRSSLVPGTTDNILGKSQDDRDVGRAPAIAKQTDQKVSLDGTVSVVVKVDGPGQVTSVTSNNKNIQPSSDFKRGRVVGGV